MPATSIERTRNTCLPGLSFLISTGETQAANPSAPLRHSNVEPGSDESNLNVARVLCVLAAGPLVNEVSGLWRSGQVP